MANSKNSRSNKTAHVLNLLTEPGETAKDSPRTERVSAAAAPAAANSEEVASAIRDALEEDLLAELAEDTPPAAEEAAPVPETPPEEQPAPKPEPEPDPEPAEAVPVEEPTPEPEPEPIPEAVAAPVEAPEPETEPEPEPEPLPEEPEPEENPMEDITYINVIQALVEDKVDKYMQKFNMCDCHRCRTDVIALALTSLPAKYIVIPEHESVPMLSIYESRYSAAVTAQLIAACQKVSQHPRHAGEHDGRLRLGAPRNDE